MGFVVYVACVFLLLFCKNPCICRVFVCLNLVYNSFFYHGIVQLDVGDATIWCQRSSFQF
jgi:hypothetical protein